MVDSADGSGNLASTVHSELRGRTAGDGTAMVTERGWRLDLPPTTTKRYELAQADDYSQRKRAGFPWRPPLRIRIRARVSTSQFNGTWGFGLWNDPFGVGLDPTRMSARLPALPQAIWFFFASPRSHVSLQDDLPANGLMGQAFRSGRMGTWVAAAALAFPFAPLRTRQLLAARIAEDAVRVVLDPEQWHAYEILWGESEGIFSVDGHQLFETQVSPRAPLAFVAWIDNQLAVFDPQGRFAWGFEANRDSAWLEVEELQFHALPGTSPEGS